VPSLAELQRGFRAALLADDDSVAAHVLGDGLAPAARLAVYRHHVRATLRAALAATYPVVERLVDARFFAYAADAYLRQAPPAGPCLFEFGAALPAFLAAFPACRHLPWLADVARLEWALNVARHAEDAPPLAPARLAALAPERAADAVLRLDPSVTLLRSPWPVDRIWSAHQGEGEPEGVDLAAGPAHLEVRREDGEARVRTLPPGPWALRAALAAGRPLGAAAEAALAEDAGLDLAAALRALLAEGLVVDLALPPPAGRPGERP
jgi:hypothetical protein